MSPQKYNKLLQWYESLVEHMKGFILAAFVIVSVLSIIIGYRYYRYTNEEPQFCAACHLMSDAFKEWQKGKHRDVVCQKCHQLSMLEKNRLLIAFVVKGKEPLAQSHGREKTWQSCRNCHMDSMSQGAKTVNKYYGHARHIFIAHTECKQCHKGDTHNFTPTGDSCKSCHTDKGVHGLGMEGFACLQCHSFSSSSALASTVPSMKCTKCHTSMPSNAPMAKLSCYECHKPHKEIKPTQDTCMLKCHSGQVEKGMHGLHLQKGMKCLNCHTAHTWQIGKEKAKRLCAKCHAYKNPQSFVY
jgi:nitrate/TMAO reductase-like tetraheme cytochrome c subunit